MRQSSQYCEVQTLQGRGTGHIDLREEAAYRCNGDLVASKTVSMDMDELRKAISTILRRELDPTTLIFHSSEHFWTSRWLWCVNGAHNRLVERKHKEYDIGDDLPKRVHRRVFVERCAVNPLEKWGGQTYYTASQKLEHGKRRAIFSCDSVTYICFEHLLRPIELAWQNRTSLLDPGKGGNTGLIYRCLRENGTHVMLDYDDFNSQHSLESIKLLFDTVCEYVGYDANLNTRIVNSFDMSEVYVGGGKCGNLKCTLMSGHRETQQDSL